MSAWLVEQWPSLVTWVFDHDGLERGVHLSPRTQRSSLGETDSEGQVSVFSVFVLDGAISDR